MSNQRLTADQLARLEAARAAGEPVPADIRKLVFSHLDLDQNETYQEDLLFQAAHNLNKTEQQLTDEVFRRHGLDPAEIIDYNVQD